ncbi:hypothetical protein F4818DRAFT_438884 [Hypoxylon cercidicola]|nr:hypothetical protein F4818DRAFT_438884 [Hypoxylon cercidicola]
MPNAAQQAELAQSNSFQKTDMILNSVTTVGGLEPPSPSTTTLITDLRELPVDVYHKVMHAMEPLDLAESQIEYTQILLPS